MTGAPPLLFAGQSSTAHQPGCVLTPNVNALALQRVPHLPHPVDTVVFGNERHEYAPREYFREDYGSLSPRALDWQYPRDVIKPPSRWMFNVWQMNKAEKRFQYSSMNRNHFLTFWAWFGYEKAEAAFNNSLVSRS
ncbi:hypothetical protein BKD85_08110 [Corynebacterium diphtheriae]|nr:hypothetical protein BKD85_08110 [Corynebacterium diphtheriae]OFI64567.1 hypothetical protein BKD81_08300 [Corynebacterium diphtheriae]